MDKQNNISVIGIGKIGKFLTETLVTRNSQINVYPWSRSADKMIGLKMESSNPRQVILKPNLEEVLSETGVSIITQCSWSEKSMPAERKYFLDGNMQLMYRLGLQFKGYTGLVMVVTNPVDECAFCFADSSGIEPERIIGLNHTDAIRYGRLLAMQFDCNPKEVSGNLTIGPHNKYVYPLRSNISIKGHHVGGLDIDITWFQQEIVNYALKQMKKRMSTTRTTVKAICEVVDAIHDSSKAVSLSTYFNGIFIGLPVRFDNGKVFPAINPQKDLIENEIEMFYRGYRAILETLKEHNISIEKLKKAHNHLRSLEPICDLKIPRIAVGDSHEFMHPNEDDTFPKQIGDYRLIEKAGSGAHGEVYKATDSAGRIVAIKISMLKKQLKAEKKLHNELWHGHILKLLDYFETPSSGFLVTEYIPYDLNSIKDKTTLEKIPVIIELFEGLSYLHDKYIAHLDLKPENILLDNQRAVKIADFALSQYIRVPSNIDPEKWAINYAAPELINGIITLGADVYSAGSIVFELLTGIPAFEARTHNPQDIKQEVPDELDTIIARCLAKNMNERYNIAKEVLTDLAKMQQKRDIIRQPPNDIVHLLPFRQLEYDLLVISYGKPLNKEMRSLLRDSFLLEAKQCEAEGNAEAASAYYKKILSVEPDNSLAINKLRIQESIIPSGEGI